MTALADFEATIGEIARRSGPAVVGLGRGWGVGSGVVIAPGRVLTNAHNLRHDEITVTFVDGRRQSGGLAGSDPDLDIAVISVETGDVEPARWIAGEESGGAEPREANAAPGEASAASREAGAGSWAAGVDPSDGGALAPIGRAVIALANPGGRGLRVTPGFVSGGARSFRGPRGRRIPGAIEHTAPLPRGSSGGPLLGVDGDLLGINTVRIEGGLILAIALDAAMRRRIDSLARGEAPSRARLGIVIMPPRAARKLRHAVGLPEREGILIRGVEDDSPASRAGLQRGDLIVAAGGRPIDGTDALYDALDAASEAGEIELALVRGSEERTLTARF